MPHSKSSQPFFILNTNRRASHLQLMILFIGSLLFCLCHAEASSVDSKQIVISGVYFDGILKGSPEPEEAIRITNIDPNKTVDLSGWSLSDRYMLLRRKKHKSKKKSRGSIRKSRRKIQRLIRSGSSRGRGLKARKKSFSAQAFSRRIIFPTGTRLAPGKSIWIAHQAKAFLRIFGKNPDYEAQESIANVKKVKIPNGWPYLFASRGILSLHNSFGEALDVLCYVRDTVVDGLDRSKVPRSHWKGGSIMLRGSSPYGWTGQILARDRYENGLPLPDTNSAADWNASFSSKQLGEDPTHRLELPGQSMFRPKRYRNVRVKIIATSAPENNFAALTGAFRKARKEILINIYQFTSIFLADALLNARKRGVRVVLLMEGSPVGGLRDKSRHIAKILARSGAKVLFMRSNSKKKIRRRYRFNHAKYVLIDGKWVIIGSENYGSTGHPINPTYGNRGWEIHVRSPQIYKELRRVFQADINRAHQDLISYQGKKGGRWGAPLKASFRPKRKRRKGTYNYRRKPLVVNGRADLELVLSPDNSLHEKSSMIGAILRCKKEVLLLQNSIPLFWGKKHFRSYSKTPNLPLAAVIKAARKGCRVRVLLDSTWYHIKSNDARDNDNTVAFLNRIAKREKLDLQAKLLNLQAASVVKIHAKGIIVDRKEIFIGSINWSENSFKGNREVGIIIRNRKVARYYTDLFMRDWIYSRIFRVIAARPYSPVRLKANSSSRVLRVYSTGDPIDVLAETGNYYQVRLHERLLGYLHKERHKPLMTPYEAQFQIGRKGVISGKIHSVVKRPKMWKFYFHPPFKRGIHVMVWKSMGKKLESKYGNLKREFTGRYIQIEGKITAYRGSPQIVLRYINQINVLY